MDQIESFHSQSGPTQPTYYLVF